MPKTKVSTTSIINILPIITYRGKECVNIFSKYDIIETYKKSLTYYINYIVQENDRWEVLANKFYGDRYLWWVIAVFNKIKDPFSELEPGTELKIIKPEHISSILYEIRKIKADNGS